jgi:hypothetical protein
MKYHITLLISSSLASTAGSIGCTDAADRGGDIPGDAHHVQVQPIDEAEPMQFHSGFPVRQRVVVRDTASWINLWPQIVGTATPVPPVPAIDFASTTVIVTATGTKPTAGYAIRIDDAATLDDDAWISVVEQSPDASCAVADVVTSPAAVVAVPRFGGSATFVEHTEVRRCQ